MTEDEIIYSNRQNLTNKLDDEFEISLADVISFIETAWKNLALAAFAGMIVGISGWFFLGSYSAEWILSNNNNNGYALDIVSWKVLQKSLPNLASQIIDENKTPPDQMAVFEMMSGESWWQKNVTPSYAISKTDIKDLAGAGKDLDAASTTILNLTLAAKGSSKEEAIQNVRAAGTFFRSGSAYLQVRNLLNGYESQVLSAVADLKQKITATQIEIEYLQERAKSLEMLHRRFPGGVNISQQVVDPKDSGAKYLPISTQIIAVNNDINNLKESLVRLQKRLAQIAVAKSFLDQATLIQDQTFDGLNLVERLLSIESDLRSKLAKEDTNGQEFLDQLHSQLINIQVRFTKGLEANTTPAASKKGLVKVATSSLFVAFCTMLFFLLGQRAWSRIKKLR